MLRQKIYRQNWQTIWIIVKNKNKKALMTKQFIWSFSYSFLLHRNNNVCFFGNQAQISDGWNKSQEQKYTGRTVITNIGSTLNILLYSWYNKKDLISVCWDKKYSSKTDRLGSLSRTKIYMHWWQYNSFDHLVTVYCYTEIT